MIAHPGVILAVAATVVYNLGFIQEKRALDRLPPLEVHQVVRLARTLFSSLAWVSGFILICVGLLMQLVVLSLEPLSVAQPLQATGVVVTLVFSRLMLRERLGGAELWCIAVIAVAALLLGLSSGHGSGSAAGTHAAGAAVAAAALPACLAVLVIYSLARVASRRQARQRVTGVTYGACAGLVYGYAGVALKALSAAMFGTPHSRYALVLVAITSPYLYVMLATSAAGMCLFQVALQRSQASIVMPISLVISTGYLVVAGSWLFHERLPASPALLAMRLAGGAAAVAVPVIMTIISERGAAAPDEVDISAAYAHAANDTRKEGRRAGPAQHRIRPRKPYEPRHAIAKPAGLPNRQAGIDIPGRLRPPVQPATTAQLPDP
jgi:drug/metabolite transporter (DMT)-like permease